MVQSMAKTKKAILKMLYENKNCSLSGQKISDQIGCSRTAVWKHIQELIREGYNIQALQRKGYRLIGAPEGLNEAGLAASRHTRLIGKQIAFFKTIDSTQKEALRMADEGAEDGTVVATHFQSAGRGRLGHSWKSASGVNIAMSLIIRPDLPIEKTPQLTLLTAVSAAETLEEETGVACGIKWPNDLLYDGKKMVGILTELQAEATFVKAVIIGIGINVNTELEIFDESIRNQATSLKAITGRTYNLNQIAGRFMERFESNYFRYLDQGFSVIKPQWEKRAVSLGKRIKVRRASGGSIQGIARGINDQGVLLLEDDDHRLTKVYSADIEWT